MIDVPAQKGRTVKIENMLRVQFSPLKMYANY